MRKSGLILLVAIIILAHRAPTLIAQSDVTDVAITPIYDAGNKNWTILFEGTTRLDKADMSVTSLTISMTDPNNTLYFILADKIKWTKPGPGESKPFTATSDTVTVTGIYTYDIALEYVDSNGMPRLYRAKAGFEVK